MSDKAVCRTAPATPGLLNTMSLATWETIKGSNSLHTTINPQLNSIESKTHPIFLEKYGISLNPVLYVWYYRLPFSLKAETQVTTEVLLLGNICTMSESSAPCTDRSTAVRVYLYCAGK